MSVRSGRQSNTLSLLFSVVTALAPPLPTARAFPAIEPISFSTNRLHGGDLRLFPSARQSRSGTLRLYYAEVPPEEKMGKLSSTGKNKSRPPNIRMKLFSFLNLPLVELSSASAVLLSIFLVAIDTLDDLPSVPGYEILGIPADPHFAIKSLLGVLNGIFAIDFFVRWYAAGNLKPKYLRNPTVLVDIFVVLVPIFIATVMPMVDDSGFRSMVSSLQFGDSGLQNLLLLRTLRLRRILQNNYTFSRFQTALGLRPQDVKPYELQLARVVLSIFTLLSVASGLIYTAEHDVNPNIPNYFVALYFGLTTLTTVGFGDISPVTPEGRFIVSMSILAGVAIIPAQAAQLVEALVGYQNDIKKGGPRVTVTAKGGNKKQPLTSDNARELSISLVAQEENRVLTTKSSQGSEDIQQVVYDGWLGRCCVECELCEGHREDSNYCWYCGSKM